MAYVEVRKGGKLVKRHLLDDARALKGCKIRVGSAGQVRLSIGESKRAGKYEIAMFEGMPSDYGPEAAGEAAQVTASFLPMSETGEQAFTGTPGARQSGKRPGFPKIEGYEITGQLGQGGMGIVWRAVQLSTKREVAIKFLGRHRFASKRSRARFEREVSLAARLTHPNIARVYHSGIHRGIYYYAMELVEGVHLDKFVKQNDLSQREILELMKGVCDAICHAHEQGVIHRDLKPSNILVTKDAQPHIVDFGLAKASMKEEDDLTISIEGEVAGTLAYMAPEQAAGRLNKISERTDVYSLGAITYELLTGRLPHDLSGSRYDTIKSIVEEEIRSPRESGQFIGLELEALLMTALAREPEDRYPSAGVFLQDISNYLNGEPLVARSLSRAYLIRKRIGKHSKSAAIVLGFAVVLFAVIAAALYSVNAARQKLIEAERRFAGGSSQTAGQTGQQEQVTGKALQVGTEPPGKLSGTPISIAAIATSKSSGQTTSQAGPVCEAAAGANCYYVDPVNGSDDSDGSLELPWRTFKNITSYYRTEYRPAGWVALKPGDCVYLMDGVFSEILHSGGDTDPEEGLSFIINLQFIYGTADKPIRLKAYPGHHPIMDPNGLGMAIRMRGSSFWEISGIEIANSHQVGLTLIGAENVNVHDVNIHDTNGVEAYNMSGLHIDGCRDINIYDCAFYDNYDRVCFDAGGKARGGSFNIRVIESANIAIHDCLIYQSLPVSHDLSGAGIRYEQASSDPNAYFHVYGNVFKNCKFFAFGSAAANTHFHHNLIVGGHGIQSRRYIGPAYQVNQRFEYNTLYNTTGFAFHFLFDTFTGDQSPGPVRDISFNNNIVYAGTTRNDQQKDIVNIWTHIPNELYNLLVPELEFNNNCYYNPNMPVQFDFGGGFNNKPEYSLGGTYSLAQWQGEYGYDADSIEADPLFIAPEQDDFRLKAGSPCAGMGVYGSKVDQQSSSGQAKADVKPAVSQTGRVREAGAGSNFYHIDAVNGNDDNDGSLSSPWKTFRNITSYYKSKYRPARWVRLQPSDCVYLMDGVFSEILHGGDSTGPDGGEPFIVYLESTDGTAEKPIRLEAYPGHHPIMNPNGLSMAAKWRRCSFWEISGIEIVNAYQCGMVLYGAKDFDIHEVKIHDTNGVEDNTVSGLNISGSKNITIHSSTFFDNYDRVCASAGGRASRNSSNVVVGGSADITIHDCLIYQTPPASSDLSGAGLRYEYPCSDPNAYFHVYRNVFKNCKFLAFGSGTANTHFHHNLVVGGHGVLSMRYAGTTHRVNQRFEYNTIYNTVDFGFGLIPTHPQRTTPFSDNPPVISFNNNIVYDATARYTHEKGAVNIGTHMSDELYNLAVSELKFNNNCYYNPNMPVQLSLGAYVVKDSNNLLGGTFSLSQWQGEYGYDADSIEADPLFIAPEQDDFRLQADSPCAGMGIYGSEADQQKSFAGQAKETTPPSSQAGWVALFNGRDLTGWTGNTKGHRARNGVLISDPASGRETLSTAREFGDFILRFEFKLAPGANNGVAIRTPLGTQASVHGMEIQILDDSSPKYNAFTPDRLNGAVYGVVPVKRGHLKPVGQWNAQEVTATGSRITVRLNGRTILDVDIDKVSTPEMIEKHPGLKSRKGRIGFCPHTESVEFRNIQIKTLD